jgi:hypothetical protein
MHDGRFDNRRFKIDVRVWLKPLGQLLLNRYIGVSSP